MYLNYLVMEFCAGGDLGMLITERKSMRLRGRRDAYLPQYFIIKIFKQLISALKDLHFNDKVTRFISTRKYISPFWSFRNIKLNLGPYSSPRSKASKCIPNWPTRRCQIGWFWTCESSKKRSFNGRFICWHSILHVPWTSPKAKIRWG